MGKMAELFKFIYVLVALKVVYAGEAPRISLSDGNKIPVIGLGTAGFNFKPEDVERARETVNTAVEVGYRHIDTAAIYGNEAELGKGIADVINKGLVKREDLFISTKVWVDKTNREDIVPALRDALSKLGLDYVDLYLLHRPIPTYLDAWKGMEDAKRLGLTKSIGVSNFNAEQIENLYANSEIKPVANQIEVNPTLTQEPLVSKCFSLGITVIAYSPFGYVVSRDRTTALPPGPNDPTLVGLAQKYGKSVTQIVLRYEVDRGLIPIPKSTNKKRMEENIDIFDFYLTQDEIAEINKFNQNKGLFN